jgi:hypothetical protein
VFLAGLYGAKQFGAAYVSGAFSYSNYWMSTNRTATVAGLNQLQADFKADNFGARLERRLPPAVADGGAVDAVCGDFRVIRFRRQFVR